MAARYFDIIRRWLWLLTLAVLVASTTTYWLEKQQPAVYQAKAQLIVGPGIDSPNPDLNALRTGGQLMQTYAELATMQPVLQTVIDNLNLNSSPGKLDNDIEVKSNQEAQILSIIVQDEDPEQAVAIANAIADTLVRLSPAKPDSPQAKFKDQMHSQATKIEVSITTAETTIKQLEADFQATTDIEKQRLIMDQLSKERDRLADAHRTLALLYDSLQRASTNQVKIVEAALQGKRINLQIQLKVWIAAMTGLVVGLVIALAFEYLDDTIKTSEELAQTTGVPLLGAIAKYKRLRGVGPKHLVIQALPKSRAAEDYRILGTKLLSEYKVNQGHYLAENYDPPGIEQLPSSSDYPLRSVLVSSSQVSDDTSEITANLAVVLAQTGHRVILVDAYLHRPTIDQLFGIVDQDGLTDILTAQSTKAPELIPVAWAPGLSILPGGQIPPNPFELLASTRMADLIRELESQADVVIVAASPLVSFADSLILATRVDGVVIVARSGKTRRSIIGNAVKSLHSLNARLVGIVLDHNRPGRLPSVGQWKGISTLMATKSRMMRMRWWGRVAASSLPKV